ncbi:cytochrome P450 [Arthrobacter cupressi]|uniref:Cytochrome P450 n=1 Tax=Arthrobacter cupressi TaxID=1045773 RepID=A0A1G8MVW6_9MICC|nr:cytochrome P450 [Arthrobacter cupressi]NYD76955.1 cytochrome P450 [Arthrobacter cupressi]SDI72054.1 Cytochrome P450 [Arthrobacter cupressi]
MKRRELERWERRLHLGAHPVLYPLIRGLGYRRPVQRIPGLGILVSDAGLLRQVLMDNERFVKHGRSASGGLWTPVVGPKALLNMDGAEHLEMRRRLGGVFTARSVAVMVEPAAARLRDRLERELPAGRGVDLVREVKELSGGVIAGILGLPADAPGRLPDRDLFDLGTSITSLVRLGRHELTPPQAAKARSAVERLAGPARAAYRDGAPDTFPGRLRELGMSEQEALGVVSAFVIVGTETLVSFIPRIVALLADAGRLSALAADRNGLPAAVNEGLRFTVPSPMMLRDAVASGTLGGVRYREGDRLLLSTIHAAKSLGGFDPERTVPPHARQLWFGAGPHFCIGMPLAMAQINSTLESLLDIYARQPWRIVSRRVKHRVLIPGYETLELANE